MKKKSSTAGFSISGEFITDMSRTRWAEGAYTSAMRILDCLIGASHEQKLEVLFGTKKLVGVNSLDLVDDSWNPEDEYDDYPSYDEGMSRGDDWQELKALREEKAWNLAYDNWPWTNGLKIGSRQEPHPVISQVEKLVGKEMATRIFDEVQNEMADRNWMSATKRDSVEHDPEITWTPSSEKTLSGVDLMYAMAQNQLKTAAIMSGVDLDSVPSIEAMKNRGSDVPVVLDEKMTSASGWLLPNGNYYGCGAMEHIGLAESLLEHIGSKMTGTENAELIAESFGWVKISRSITGLYVGCKKTPTKKQFDKLWDYSVQHKKDYEEMVKLLKASKHDFAR